MAFPKRERFVYKKNTLAEVSARFQFNPILKIETAAPAQFQDAIRIDYPIYQSEIIGPTFPKDMPAAIQNMVRPMFDTGQSQSQHAFVSDDQCWRIVLSRDTLVLQTKKYTTWIDFETRLAKVRKAFEEIYQPGRYSELHLRYVNVIQRSKLGLQDRSWADLLNPYIAGELAYTEIADTVDKMSRELHCKLDGEGSYLWLKTALARQQGQVNSKELAFVIDNDFHTHKNDFHTQKSNDFTNVDTIFRRFNEHSRDLFQWAITPRLHDAMEPQVG